MRIFVTGATGWIGSAVVPELIGAGHQVVGLARSDAAAAAVSALGADVQRGELDDLDSLRAGAGAADGVVHLGYNHDFSRMEAAAATDLAAITVLGEALAGSGGPLVAPAGGSPGVSAAQLHAGRTGGQPEYDQVRGLPAGTPSVKLDPPIPQTNLRRRPLVIAAGVLGLAVGRVATEQDAPPPGLHPRAANADAALASAERGVRPVVVRFAPTVHGPGDPGFLAVLVAIAREKGVSGYIGDGAHRWPAVHQRDAAALIRRAVEAAPAGSVLHATAEEGVATRAIAEAIGRGLDLPVESVPGDRAGEHFGWMARFFGVDSAASSAATRRLLGWEPVHPGLLDDLAAGYYFKP